MSKIYKINHTINNQIQNIYVFKGNYVIEETSNGPKVNDNLLFTETEWSNISQNDISLTYIDKFVHDDDTIIRLKEKILRECKGLNSSTNEMYLFSLQNKKLESDIYYNKLTQNGNLDLTDIRLKQFLFNILNDESNLQSKQNFFKEGQQKELYTYEDILNLNLDWDKKQILTNPIGQKIIINRNYPYIANPFNNDLQDNLLSKEGANILSTQNSYLLFKYFPIINNNIYLCLAKDVVKQEKINIDDKYLLKLYFPQLYKEIKSKTELESKGARLYDSEKNKVKKYYNAYNDRIDLFYNIFNSLNNDVFEKKGIANLHITIHPVSNIKLPLEVLFKIIHSTNKLPLIKYNPGDKYENIYRLFTNSYISIDGKKIPSLYVENNNRKREIEFVSKSLSKKRVLDFI